jgi:cysteinyl-tRNA synthetase
MAEKHLGPEFELHGGGLDLRFPHHENEIAQSRGAGRSFARRWAHNGMLEFGAEKMSKSLGNVVTLHDALERWGREAILILFLGAHYRSPVDFTDEAMEQAAAQWEDFRTAFRVAATRGDAPTWDDFAAPLDDDFSTPTALAILHEWRAAGRLEELARGLAIFGLEPQTEAGEAPAEVCALAEAREVARAARDFEEADRLRGEIEAAGWEVQDVAGGFRLIPRA